VTGTTRPTGTVVLRPERPNDFPAIAAVIGDAFGAHGEEVTRLVERIRASEHYRPDLALVAEDETGVIGHVMLSWVGLEGAARDRILNLTPMSVRGDRQRQGVGSQLVRAVLALADDLGEPLVMVEGVPSYYPRFGFERARSCGFEPPRSDIPDDAFMIKRLLAFDPELGGRVIYPPTFAELEPPAAV